MQKTKEEIKSMNVINSQINEFVDNEINVIDNRLNEWMSSSIFIFGLTIGVALRVGGGSRGGGWP